MITLITPTCDRPAALALSELWMSRQTAAFDRWIVCDGGQNKAHLTMGQEHIHIPSAPGAENFALNIMRGLDDVEFSDIVIIIEDDDWYAPNHIEECIKGIEQDGVHGCPTLRYFNVAKNSWRIIQNKGSRGDSSALSQTAFQGYEMWHAMNEAARKALSNKDYRIDGRFWESINIIPCGPETVVGIKGYTGTPGLGVGHKPGTGWTADPERSKLQEWIGDDVKFL